MDYNWLSPKAEARPVGAKGWGSFATEPIAKGTSVAGFGGWVVTRETLATFSEDRQGRSIQIDEDLYLVSDDTPEPGDMLNHSCEPSCGLIGATRPRRAARHRGGRGAHLRLRHLRLQRLRRVHLPLRRAHLPRHRDRPRLDQARAPGQVRRLVHPYLARRIAALPAITADGIRRAVFGWRKDSAPRRGPRSARERHTADRTLDPLRADLPVRLAVRGARYVDGADSADLDAVEALVRGATSRPWACATPGATRSPTC